MRDRYFLAKPEKTALRNAVVEATLMTSIVRIGYERLLKKDLFPITSWILHSDRGRRVRVTWYGASGRSFSYTYAPTNSNLSLIFSGREVSKEEFLAEIL